MQQRAAPLRAGREQGETLLAAVLRRHAGEAALIQRCQIHKKRNVLDHLLPGTPSHRGSASKLNNAYAMAEYAEARRALRPTALRKLMDLNPSAGISRQPGLEGLEETLTVHKLRAAGLTTEKRWLSTNVIESAFSIVEMIGRNVKELGRGGDHLERLGWRSALLVAEKNWIRGVRGYRADPATVRGRHRPHFLGKGVAEALPELLNI